MKNKKSIAMAMAAVSTMGAVAPVFAAEIVGTVVREMNLDLLRSDDAAVRIKAEKDLEKTKEYLEKMYAEKDTNGNKVYKFTETDTVDTISGVKKVIKTIVISRNDDVTNKEEVDRFVFTASQLDPGFGQEVPVQKITLNVGYEAKRTELSKMIYELNKGSKKSTVLVDKSQTGKLILNVYAGKIGQDQVDNGEAVQLAEITLEGALASNLDELKKKLVFVDANNDFLGHWAEDTIVDSMIAGIIDNSAKFRPEDSITRAEFAKVACKAFGLDEIEAKDYNGEFNDVKKSDWYVGYIASMAKAGYMKGDGNKTFRPEDKITREEAAVVIAQMHNELVKGNKDKIEQVTTDVNGNRVHKDTVTNFVDDEKISVWADESVAYLVENGLSNGYTVADGTGRKEYKPANQIKRAEAVVMMNRSLLK